MDERWTNDGRTMDERFGRTIRTGVSLIELVVVISMIALIAGVSLPMILSSRSSARLLQCSNHLRQFGVASLNYLGAKNRFPPGTVGIAIPPQAEEFRQDTGSDSWRNITNSSFQLLLLPFMEGNSLVGEISPIFLSTNTQLIDFRNSGTPASWFGEIDGFQTLVTTIMPGSECPDDQVAAGTLILFGTQPVIKLEIDRLDGITSLDDRFADFFKANTAAKTNYAACSGAHSGGLWQDNLRNSFRGAMSSGEKINSAKIIDGLSNTVIIGETIGGVGSGSQDGGDRMRSSWAIGGLCRMRGEVPWMNDLNGIIAPSSLMLGNSRYSYPVGFGSKHVAGVNFVNADGSCETIAFNTDWKILYRKSGIADSKHNF